MKIYTSESVSVGHPDKLADQISDAILDEMLRQDPHARVAVETLLSRGLAVVAGEVTTTGYVDVTGIVRRTIQHAGYDHSSQGFDGGTCGVMIAIQPQSRDIAQGVDTGGAGDQGMMFGMAVRETPELMPLPISIAHALTRRARDVRRAHPELGLRPDVKSQVSVRYENDRPVAVDTVVLSHQHDARYRDDQATLHDLVRTRIIAPVLADYPEYADGDPRVLINPTGVFEEGGPQGDTGLTGRKIIVDTYGGMCPHGGGAFSGKDPTKVDRSAAYIARHVAKTVVAAGLADRAVVQLAYAIGVAEPVAVNVDTFGTETIAPEEIVRRVRAAFDLTPKGIIEHLDLRRPIYSATAENGHFGNPAFPWESLEHVSRLTA